MAPLISWICRADHAVRSAKGSRPTVTIHEGKWAYCAVDALIDCVWEAIPPTPLEQVRPVPLASETMAKRASGVAD